MKILYSAIDQIVPGTKGGSIHVAAVAEGLAALGHDVTALITPAQPGDMGRASGVRWIDMTPPFGSTHLRMARASRIARLVRGIRPDVVMERYHNFGGEAITAARAVGAIAVLEVNAPIVDHRGSRKAIVDRLLLVRPMQQWRERLVRLADVIVTPSAAILPADTPSIASACSSGALIRIAFARIRPDPRRSSGRPSRPSRCSPELFEAGTARSIWCARFENCRRVDVTTSVRC